MKNVRVEDLPEAGELEGLDIEVQPETLAGDVRDAMLQRIKGLRSPWGHMTETEQNELAEGLAYDARRLVEAAIQALSAFEFPRAVAKMARMSVNPDKKTIECKLEFQLIPENLEVLGVNVGSMVAVVMVDSSQFKGEREPVKVDPDQPDLPMEGDPRKLEEQRNLTRRTRDGSGNPLPPADDQDGEGTQEDDSPDYYTRQGEAAPWPEVRPEDSELNGGGEVYDGTSVPAGLKATRDPAEVFEAPEDELAAQPARRKLRAARESAAQASA